MRSLTRIWALAAKEVRHVLRDPRSLYLALGMPVVMLLLFGYGVSFDLDGLPLAFVDLDQSQTSRELRQRFTSGPEFVDGGLIDEDEAEGRLVSGRAMAVIVIEHGFERHLRRGEDAHLQVLIDGSDNNGATQTRAKTEMMGRIFGFQAATRVVSASGSAIEARATRPSRRRSSGPTSC